MSAVTGTVGSALAAIVGAPRVQEGETAPASFALDGARPRWVVRPETLLHVSQVLGLAWDAGLAVVPWGSGRDQELGAPPARVDILLDLGGLDQVLEYNPDDLTVTVQAGVTAAALAARLGARRQFLPLDPPGAEARTLGGMTATNASGPRWCGRKSSAKSGVASSTAAMRSTRFRSAPPGRATPHAASSGPTLHGWRRTHARTVASSGARGSGKCVRLAATYRSTWAGLGSRPTR